jgi:hypothetical protein
MAIYYRPNFSEEQVSKLSLLLECELERLGISHPDFESLYRALLKLKDSRPFSTDRKEPTK